MKTENGTPEINESLIFSVSEITHHLKQVLETQIEALYVAGEIGSFLRHNSGHIYFNLKDENAVIRCAFFRNQNYQLDFEPQDGDQVVCFGKISIFEKSGQYQLIIQNMFPSGKGILLQKFEQLKQKLKSEGLFDPEHKRPLPKYPGTIGIITSPTGAALQDILNILSRRYPCQVKVFPSLMQGAEAPRQVINGLDCFNREQDVDLIIIARGGGSQEDLFAFNDESLARAVYNSGLPVVSAIGHEIDFTVIDFVADLRAPTPSAAAELATPDRAEVNLGLDSISRSLSMVAGRYLINLQNELHKSQIRLMHYNPERALQSYQQRFDEAAAGLLRLDETIESLRKETDQLQRLFCREVMHAGSQISRSGQHKAELAATRLDFALRSKMQKIAYKLDLAEAGLDDLSPRKVLARGYSIVRKQGTTINSIRNVKVGDELEMIMSDGKADVAVRAVEQNRERDAEK